MDLLNLYRAREGKPFPSVNLALFVGSSGADGRKVQIEQTNAERKVTSDQRPYIPYLIYLTIRF